MKKIKRKNPKYLPFNKIYEILNYTFALQPLGQQNTREGKAYYFKINKNIKIFDQVLHPGEYVVKIYNGSKKFKEEKAYSHLNFRQIKYLKDLSKYGLIPKIYYLDENTMIMKYIKGIRLRDFISEYPNMLEEIKLKYAKLIKIWEKLGFEHRDILQYEFEKERYDDWIRTSNVLVTLKNNDIHLYFIDPYVDHLNEWWQY